MAAVVFSKANVSSACFAVICTSTFLIEAVTEMPAFEYSLYPFFFAVISTVTSSDAVRASLSKSSVISGIDTVPAKVVSSVFSAIVSVPFFSRYSMLTPSSNSPESFLTVIVKPSDCTSALACILNMLNGIIETTINKTRYHARTRSLTFLLPFIIFSPIL